MKYNYNLYQKLESETLLYKSFLKEISELFNIKYEDNIFNFLPINAKEKVLLDFLGGCPGEPHCKWGNNIDLRINKINEFVNSSDYENYCNTLNNSGSVISLNVTDNLTKALKNFSIIPEWINSFVDVLNKNKKFFIKNWIFLCLINDEKNAVKNIGKLLVHEWVHLLFFENDITFQNRSEKKTLAWLYDEGIATWIETVYETGTFDNVKLLKERAEILKSRNAPETVTGYYETAYEVNKRFILHNTKQWPNILKDLLNEVEEL